LKDDRDLHGNLLILPATVPIDDACVQAELTRCLENR
jgi:hypothetical protein